MKKSKRKVIYLSTDVETDGPIPGINSMLSFASVAMDEKKNILGEFEANLHLIHGAKSDPKTMSWWNERENSSAFATTRVNLKSADEAMPDYLKWIESLPGRPVFVAYPLAFDFMFVYWYLLRFAGRSPFAHRGLDIRSYAMGMLNIGFFEASKENYPKEWFDPLPETHIALDDARAQGALFINMINANLKQ
ncbi:MAG: 3'-5' exoribonuclease [Bacteriovorax sp.]|nr:3'-5' exoribonuclease [Bacteriovorax sp.]